MYQALSRKIEAMYGPAQGGSPAGPSAAAAAAGQLMTFGQWDAHMTRITKGNTTLHDVWALMLAAVPGEADSVRRSASQGYWVCTLFVLCSWGGRYHSHPVSYTLKACLPFSQYHIYKVGCY